MYVIVSSTNRQGSVSIKLATIYFNLLKDKGIDSQIIDLCDLPDDYLSSALYEKNGLNKIFNGQRETMLKASKFVFIVPEYNGSFPGVLKAFIDGLKFPATFTDKKCALVGLSSGQQGAGLALSHLTDIFNYCGMNVLAYRPRLSNIKENINMTEKMLSDQYRDYLQRQIDKFIPY
ncbi:MAG: NAD(P)H-dependent oxidoreductase [Bacteroidetes bacterium]|nr:NAD(P)H-dependent oxidoreductase [Bacteroidota bacterium]MDA1121092.1 NAD(P)H-dependent oxidoreductase [Bacteroidota bacterium]